MDRKTSRELVIMYILSFLFMTGNMTPNPLVAGYSVSLGAGAALMSLISGMASFFAFVFRPIVGNMADRVNRRNLMAAGMLMMVAAAALHYFAVNPYILAVGRIASGVSFTFCSVCLPVWMSAKVDRSELGKVITIYGTMNAIALAIAPSLAVAIYSKLGYKTVFGILTIIVFIGFLCVFLIGNDDRRGEEKTVEKRKLNIVSREAVPVSSITMLQCVVYFATQTYLIQYAEARSLNITVSLFFPIYAILLTLIRIAIGRIVDRIPYKVFFWSSVVSMSAYIMCMATMKSNAGMIAAAVFLATGYGIMYPVCQAKAIMRAGKGKEGIGNSTFYMGLDIGVTLGGALGGVIFTSLPVDMFFPCLAVTIPISIVIYLLWIRRDATEKI